MDLAELHVAEYLFDMKHKISHTDNAIHNPFYFGKGWNTLRNFFRHIFPPDLQSGADLQKTVKSIMGKDLGILAS